MSSNIDIRLIIEIALLVTTAGALLANYKRDLMMLQQNSYRNERYTRWINQSHETTTNLRMGGYIAFFAVLVYNIPFIATGTVAALIMIATIITLAVKKYKKPLVWTNRAKRIYLTMVVISILGAGLTGWLTRSVYNACCVALALNMVSPVVIMIANIILQPVEKMINRKYYNEAAKILEQMPDLTIIGVTGSYGKTSTKHYLNRILSEKYDVAMTPGSFNTTLGVIRTIREHLKPYNEVFIVEMGAKQLGDIDEICRLVKPSIGVVTAVGEQHLESFKTIENIQKTKFELIDSLPVTGFGVVNDDFEMVANREVSNTQCLRYAVRNTGNADYVATDIKLDSTGTTFTIKGEGKSITLHTKLVGECNVSNLMAAVIIALRLGVEEQKIAYAVEKIEQVEHRLNMKRTPGGITIIDDAFNSNPTGSRMALEVLGAMQGGKRIVVTPGMIELGEKQFELNKQLGEHAAQNADLVIVVGEYNKEAIATGLTEGGIADDKVIFAASFDEAQKRLATILQPGDIILYENDLPDTFK